METTTGPASRPAAADAPALHERVTRWMARADERLQRPADPGADRATLREALELAAEEPGVEREAWREGTASAGLALNESPGFARRRRRVVVSVRDAAGSPGLAAPAVTRGWA